jgi:hypothetical protein
MPYLCLERCGLTHTRAMQETMAVLVHRDLLQEQGVSFERYNLGPNASLVVNTPDKNLTDISPLLREYGIKGIPMVSSWPYPPQLLDYMREMWGAPVKFADTLIAQIQTDGMQGASVDLEPAGAKPTPADAVDYARFLGYLRRRFDEAGLRLVVNAALWSPIWNLTLIGDALAGLPVGAAVARPLAGKGAKDTGALGTISFMGTYANELSTFTAELAMARKLVSVGAVLQGGLQVLPDVDPSERFALLREAGVCSAAVWAAPLPANWWEAVRNFTETPCTTY